MAGRFRKPATPRLWDSRQNDEGRCCPSRGFSGWRRMPRVAVERRDGMLIVYGRGLREISPVAERLARARYLLETTCACPIMVRAQAIRPAAASHVAGHARKVAAGSRSSA